MGQQEVFEPQNELERRLLSTLEGGMDGDDFIASLLHAQVFMPVQDEPGESEVAPHPAHAQPLVLQDEEGRPVLVLFTSPARAKEFMQDFPDYGGGLLTEFSWVLRRMGSPVAIIVNPDQEAGFDLEADSVAELMASLPPAA
ncbi:MAG TPA: SseB family protein [Gallionellaceae bacterium]